METTTAERPSWSIDVARLDGARILRGLTQRDLARLANVDQGTLSDLLSRRRRPYFGTISALCRALGLQLSEVIRIGADDSADT